MLCHIGDSFSVVRFSSHDEEIPHPEFLNNDIVVNGYVRKTGRFFTSVSYADNQKWEKGGAGLGSGPWVLFKIVDYQEGD